MSSASIITWIFSETPLKWFLQSYWRDEAFSVLLASRPIGELLVFTARDFSPPLYYLVLKLWMVPFGTDIIATRSLSLLFYVLTLFVMHEILVLHFKIRIRTALPLLLFFGLLNPLLVYYAFETRMYTMLAFFASLSWYAFLRKQRWLYIVACTLGLFTHYFMALTVVSHVAVSLLREGVSWRYRTLIRHLLLVGGSFGGWALFTLIQKDPNTTQSFWISRPHLAQFLEMPAFALLGAEPNIGFTYPAWPISLLLILITSLALLVGVQKKPSLLAIVAWWFVPVFITFTVSLFTVPLYLSRYLIATTPGIILMCILVLLRLRRPYRLGLLCILGFTLITFLSIQLRTYVKEDVANKISSIKLFAQPGDELWLTDELNYHTAQYYWYDPDDVKIIDKQYDKIPSYVGKVLIPPSAVKSSYTYPVGHKVHLLNTKQRLFFRF